MKKKAQFSSVMNEVLNMIKSTPPDVKPFESKYPAIAQSRQFIPLFEIKAVQTPPQGKYDAIGYVTTGDADDDGIVDTINIVSPAVEKYFKNQFLDKNISQFKTLKGEQMAVFLNEIAHVIVHEAAHLGRKPLKLDPTKPESGILPEGVAESAVLKPIAFTNSKKINKLATYGDIMEKELRALKKYLSKSNTEKEKEVDSLIKLNRNLSDVGIIRKAYSSMGEILGGGSGALAGGSFLSQMGQAIAERAGASPEAARSIGLLAGGAGALAGGYFGQQLGESAQSYLSGAQAPDPKLEFKRNLKKLSGNSDTFETKTWDDPASYSLGDVDNYFVRVNLKGTPSIFSLVRDEWGSDNTVVYGAGLSPGSESKTKDEALDLLNAGINDISIDQKFILEAFRDELMGKPIPSPTPEPVPAPAPEPVPAPATEPAPISTLPAKTPRQVRREIGQSAREKRRERRAKRKAQRMNKLRGI